MPGEPPEMDENGGLSRAAVTRRVNELIEREGILVPPDPEDRKKLLKKLMLRVLKEAHDEAIVNRGVPH